MPTKIKINRKARAAIKKAKDSMQQSTNDVLAAKIIEAYNNAEKCPHCATLAALCDMAADVLN